MDPQIQKLRDINLEKAKSALETERYQSLLISDKNTRDTILSTTESLIRYMQGSISKVQLTNQLRSINTPDALKIIPSIEALHETLKLHKNTDLTEITAVMTAILDESKKLPKELPKTEKQQFIDYTKQFSALGDAVKAVEKVVKAQKLIAEAPIIKNAAPIVNVPKLDLAPLQGNIRDVVKAVEKIVIPEYKTDNKEVEGLLKKSNKLLKDLLDKPVGGGGGGGRATPYQDSGGIPAFVTLTAAGNVPVDIQDASITVTGSLTDAELRATAVPISGTITANPTVPSTVFAFVTAVTTAGTRVQLASNTLTNGAILQAPSTNTGIIYIGTVTVSSTVYGAELQPGQATSFAGNNTNLIYIDSSANGDKCACLGS